ncbi:MAG: hypothetical protein AB7T06_25430 [Kofleriaceae bacterium]
MRVVLVLALLGACAPSLPHATAVDADRANVELAELERGRSIVLKKCGGCHKPPLPTDAWQPVMADMAARAKLDAEQRRLAEQYLSVMAVTN